ncbi:MAG: transposase, partial [Sandarakinorhabdus sp.]|nr:transposase [Sandarakinorhabdus sp.]
MVTLPPRPGDEAHLARRSRSASRARRRAGPLRAPPPRADRAVPKLVTPVLQGVHRVITRHLLGQAGLEADEADSGAVTLIQRFGSAANLDTHLHCLVLDGVYRRGA